MTDEYTKNEDGLLEVTKPVTVVLSLEQLTANRDAKAQQIADLTAEYEASLSLLTSELATIDESIVQANNLGVVWKKEEQ